MKQIEIKNRWTDEIIIAGKYESIKDCLQKNRDAYLGGAYLRGAYLRDAYLGGAYLGGAKNYYMSHDFGMEIIHRQKIETFTEKEWAIIGQIMIHRICWETIRKKYPKIGLSIGKKIAKAGFDEYLRKFRGELRLLTKR